MSENNLKEVTNTMTGSSVMHQQILMVSYNVMILQLKKPQMI